MEVAGAEPSCATLLEDEVAMAPEEDEAERSGEGGGLAVDGTREPAGEGVDIVLVNFEDSGLASGPRNTP